MTAPDPLSSSEASLLLHCRPPGPRGQALTPDHEATAERRQGASGYGQRGERFGEAHKPPAPQSWHKPHRGPGAPTLSAETRRQERGRTARLTSPPRKQRLRGLAHEMQGGGAPAHLPPEGHLSWRRRWKSLWKGGHKAGPHSLGCQPARHCGPDIVMYTSQGLEGHPGMGSPPSVPPKRLHKPPVMRDPLCGPHAST